MNAFVGTLDIGFQVRAGKAPLPKSLPAAQIVVQMMALWPLVPCRIKDMRAQRKPGSIDR